MSATFTPGPWTAYEFGADWYVAHNHDDSGPMLRVGSIHASREANANLIAAAPDLYGALKLHVAYEQTPADRGGKSGRKGMAWTAFVDARDTALAKARGEA